MSRPASGAAAPKRAATPSTTTSTTGTTGGAAATGEPKDRVRDVSARVAEVKDVLKENIRTSTPTPTPNVKTPNAKCQSPSSLTILCL
jgi:hypothetical protein